MRAMWPPVIALAGLIWLGCDRERAVTSSGCADAGGRTTIAAVRVSLSTNSSEIDVAVFCDGSAERTLGPSRPGGTTSNDPPPMSFPAGSPQVAAFLADLSTVGPVSQIPTSPCTKSVSFGTTTVVTVGADTSGDLECLAATASPAAHALASDCDTLSDRR
jgi:hypothetical protein